MKTITLSLGKYTNANGEDKEFLAVAHPEHKNRIRLLNKKKVGSDERMNCTEMVEFLKTLPDWRSRLEFVVNEEYGDYFVISMVNHSTIDI